MARMNLSIPHERLKAKLKSRALTLRVRIAEAKQALGETKSQIQSMRPPAKKQ